MVSGPCEGWQCDNITAVAQGTMQFSEGPVVIPEKNGGVCPPPQTWTAFCFVGCPINCVMRCVFLT